jgi:hypothetical protein
MYFAGNPKFIMKKSNLFILAFLFSGMTLYGQQTETLFGRNGLHLTGTWGSTGPGYSVFSAESGFTRGGFLALEFNKDLLIGVGGGHTAEAVHFGNGSYDLDYGGLVLGYVPNSFKVIHPKFSFLMGSGKLKVSGEDEDDIFVVQPGAGVELNVFRWFKFGVEGGYRFVSNVDQEALSGSDVSSFFVNLNFRFGWSWGGNRE